MAVLLALLAGARLLHVGGHARAAPAGESPAVTLEAEQAEARRASSCTSSAPCAQPGLYRLEEGSRVDDAIGRAGGATGKAALELVNLAAPVADGQQVVVPKAGEAPAARCAAARPAARAVAST